jgi:hypothetical protein
MTRLRVTEAALNEILLTEIGRFLGKDPSYLSKTLSIRRQAGEPNWDAKIGIAPPMVMSAFDKARDLIQQVYELD